MSSLARLLIMFALIVACVLLATLAEEHHRRLGATRPTSAPGAK